jgi:hypothetical protein
MGMYNEVFDTCPSCGKHSGYLQIAQVVLGFGNFDLSDLSTLHRRYQAGDLSKEDLDRLASCLEDETFYCSESDNPCNHAWRVDPAKVLAIRLMTEVANDTDIRARALQLLTEAGITD